MKPVLISENLLSDALRVQPEDRLRPHLSKTPRGPMVYGIHKSLIATAIWINVMLLAIWYFKNSFKSLKAFRELKKLRNDLRGNNRILKYAKATDKYYFTLKAPGWPSLAFNKYILNIIKKGDTRANHVTLNTILFGITKKCGYKCEHCFEWNSLNQPETLTRENLLSIILSFQRTGISQIHLSGGEPLNRFDDIIYLLQKIKRGTELWLYTSGYHFTGERAAVLKRNGCTGIVVSLDHWIPELHDKFRGKSNAFFWAEKAVAHARENALVIGLSLCATRDFISRNNLQQFAELAKQWGVSFIQVLEPRAVGHYAGKNVALSQADIAMLEEFYLAYNYDKKYNSYPAIVYHGFYNRRVRCGGGGNHYVYIDTDGDVHNCPFCQRKIFSALNGDLKENLRLMAAGGCTAFTQT